MDAARSNSNSIEMNDLTVYIKYILNKHNLSKLLSFRSSKLEHNK